MISFFSQNLKYLRKLKKLSQEDLGRIFGKSSSTIGGWETGYSYPDYATTFEICDYFGVGIGDLVEFDLEEMVGISEVLKEERGEKVNRILFKKNIEQLMNKLEIEVSDLAKVTGFPLLAIEYHLKNNDTKFKIPFKLIDGLARYLNVNTNWLLYGEGEMFKEGSEVGSKNNIISNSKKLKDVHQVQGGQSNGSDASKDVVIESLTREVEFLKKQLEYTQSLLEKSISK